MKQVYQNGDKVKVMDCQPGDYLHTHGGFFQVEKIPAAIPEQGYTLGITCIGRFDWFESTNIDQTQLDYFNHDFEFISKDCNTILSMINFLAKQFNDHEFQISKKWLSSQTPEIDTSKFTTNIKIIM